jgi:hypothetical protein
MSPKGKRNPDTAFLSRTTIAPEKTAAEIQELLSRRARRVMSEYDAGEVVAISFSMVIEGQEILFRLPVRWENYFKVLQRQHIRNRKARGEVSEAQARRTAWRVAKAWLEAQLGMIDSEMVELQEVMLPYIVQRGGQETLYERLAKTGFLLEHK